TRCPISNRSISSAARALSALRASADGTGQRSWDFLKTRDRSQVDANVAASVTDIGSGVEVRAVTDAGMPSREQRGRWPDLTFDRPWAASLEEATPSRLRTILPHGAGDAADLHP